MTYRRLLTSLAGHPPSTSASRLIPPYAQTINADAPSGSFRPPYAHALAARSLKAPRRFELVLAASAAKKGKAEWAEWARKALGDDGTRRQLEGKWKEVLTGLERIKAGEVVIPQIPYTQLSTHLASAASVEDIKTVGAVVVRDVVPDAEAIEWARAVLISTGERGGKDTYWHRSLLAARSDPSVLTANAAIAKCLLPSAKNGVFVAASAITEGLTAQPSLPSLTDAWSNPRALSSHLTLTPAIPTATSVVSPSILAAEYALLRPLFRSNNSKISFYSSAGYLDPENWSLLDGPSPASEIAMDLPHLASVQVDLPELRPGDMILTHSSLPVRSTPGSGQVFLPLQPVPKRDNETWIAEQKTAFEKGLPPPGVVLVDGLWEVEAHGKKELLGGRAGRGAMGYD
ncbi:hypothetical protein IAU60_003761 [Kwoniella sp. DSM 27419]